MVLMVFLPRGSLSDMYKSVPVRIRAAPMNQGMALSFSMASLKGTMTNSGTVASRIM